MVETLLKYSIPLAMVIATAVMLWPAGGALAAPLGEGPAGQITDLKLRNAGQLAYLAEDTVTVSLTATNNGSVRAEYRASLVIIASDGSIAYDSGSQGGDREFPLNPGEAATVFFSWAVHRTSPAGTYMVAAKLMDRSDSSILFDENLGGVTFEVLRQPRLSLQRNLWDFGNILPGATPEVRIAASNANPDAGEICR